MKINGKDISIYYSEIKELETIVFKYDLEVLEGLQKFIRANREKDKTFCVELAISNPPLSEESHGYQYPEGIEPVDYWMQKISYKFEEYDYFEALISKVFDAKIPAFMKPAEEFQEVKTGESLKLDTHFDFKTLFVSEDQFQKFIKGLISLGIVDEATWLKKPEAQINEFGGILRLLHSKGFISRDLKTPELETAANLFGFSGKADTLRKGNFSEKRFHDHFLK